MLAQPMTILHGVTDAAIYVHQSQQEKKRHLSCGTIKWVIFLRKFLDCVLAPMFLLRFGIKIQFSKIRTSSVIKIRICYTQYPTRKRIQMKIIFNKCLTANQGRNIFTTEHSFVNSLLMLLGQEYFLT